jgi:hypothetical protein
MVGVIVRAGHDILSSPGIARILGLLRPCVKIATIFDMWKIQIQKYIFSALVILLLSGCARESLADNSEINQQEAIDTAIEIASMSMPEISGSQVAPSNIHAEKMTLEAATKRLNSNSQTAFSEESPDTQVWLVSMDGIWLPADVPGVIQKPYQHLSIVMDAKTGLEIFRNVQP